MKIICKKYFKGICERRRETVKKTLRRMQETKYKKLKRDKCSKKLGKKKRRGREYEEKRQNVSHKVGKSDLP
jgi:hypothetical protein